MKRAFRATMTIALLLAVYYIFQVLFLSLSTALLFKITSGIPADAIDHLNNAEYLKANPAVQACMVNARALAIFLSSVSMLLFVHFTGFYRLRRRLLRSLDARTLLISTLLVFSSMFALNIFVQWFPLEDNLGGIFDGLSRNALGIFGLAVLAPLLEEVLFRGAIQGYLMRFFGRPWPAIIVASMVFGIFHWNPVQIVYATLLGIIFGWIYYRTGSLLSVIVGHILNNTFAVITTVSASAAEEEAAASGSSGIAGFVLFAALSLYLAKKLHTSLPPVNSKPL